MGKRKEREVDEEEEETIQTISSKALNVFEYNSDDDDDEELEDDNEDNEGEEEEGEDEESEEEDSEDDDEEGEDEDEDLEGEKEGWKHGNYHILPIRDASTGLLRYLYFKKHQSSSSEGKTIFITNIPPSMTLSEVLLIFSNFGKIKEITSGYINPTPAPNTSTAPTKKNYINYNSNANIGLSSASDYDLSLRKINQLDTSKALFKQPDLGGKKPRKKRNKNNNNSQNNANDANNSNENNNVEKRNSIFDANNKKKKLRKDPKFTKGHFIHLTYFLMKSVNKLMSSSKSQSLSYNFSYNNNGNTTTDSSESPSTPPVGLQCWMRDYEEKRQLQREVMQKEFDDFMLLFDRKKATERKEMEKKRNMMDEDGFIMVQPRKKKQTDGEVAVGGVKVGRVIAEMNSADKKKKKAKVLDNFYKFQKQEARVKKLTELKRKFEEDKKRIQHLKSNRHFKPF